MQPDCRFVQHIEHAAQIGAKLRSETNSLGFAAAQCFRRPAKREITKTNVLHETQALLNLWKQLSGDCFLCPAEPQFPCKLPRLAC